MPAPPPPAPALPQIQITDESNILISQWAKIDDNSTINDTEKLIKRHNLTEAKVLFYCHLEPILQDGPQCGLVALSMVSQLCKKKVNVSELLSEAKNQGISKHGELYSVGFMRKLALHYLSNFKPIVFVNLQSAPKNIIYALENGVLVLIPYDADYNHYPCLKNGHKAHWALLVGLISSKQGYFVIARHGKSRYLACWSLKDLLASNANLEEEGSIRHKGGYVIPNGGVGGKRGLKNRALALYSYN